MRCGPWSAQSLNRTSLLLALRLIFSRDLFPLTKPASPLLFVGLGHLALLAFIGYLAQLALDELLLVLHLVRQGDEERLHLLPVAVDLLLLALREVYPPGKGEVLQSLELKRGSSVFVFRLKRPFHSRIWEKVVTEQRARMVRKSSRGKRR